LKRVEQAWHRRNLVMVIVMVIGRRTGRLSAKLVRRAALRQ
jgi:hypothetical protein